MLRTDELRALREMSHLKQCLWVLPGRVKTDAQRCGSDFVGWADFGGTGLE